MLLSCFGFLLIGIIMAISLNMPLILQDTTTLGAKAIGYVVALGGLLGAAAIIYGGNHADRHGDRCGNAFWCCIVLAARSW